MNKLGIMITFLIMAQLVFAGVSGPSPIPSPPNWAINTSATAVCKGHVNYIPITVINRGSPYQQGAQNISGAVMQSVQLGVVNAKSIYSITTVNLGSIKPGSSATANVPMLITGDASSLISPQISINYFYYSLYSDSETSNITFSTQPCPTPLSVKVSPEVLTAGTIQNISVNLTNSGTMPINSISLHFTLPSTDGAWLSTQPVQINSLGPGKTMLLRQNVYIANNQTDQSVPLNLSVIFYNGSQINQISQTLAILAGGLIILGPSGFTVSPSVPNPNSVFSISFILTNTGTTGASGTTATIIPPKGFTTFGSNTVFVGSIPQDSQTPVTLSLLASNSVKPGNYTIPIRVNYLNNLRDNLSIWANTSVYIGKAQANFSQGTRSQSGGSGGLGMYVLLALLIIVGYLFYKERMANHSIREKKAQ